METPPDRSWVEFTLNPKAKFSDGQPVTVDDVIFSMEILRDKGRPNYAATYGKIDSVERVGERGVRFNIANANDRELPLILGLMPILPKHAINPETFDKSTLTPIIGSGPYILSEVHAPDYTVYKRNPDYWGKDLPIKRGVDNYDEIRVDYYRDANTMFEAFKKGLYDVQPEGDPSAWNANYDFPAVTDGRVVKETFKTGSPKGMQGFTFNTRRPIFADVRVRRALASLLDFDVDQQESLLRRLRPRRRLLQRLRSLLDRPAGERQGEGAAGALPGRCCRRRDGRHVQAGRFQRRGRRPRRFSAKSLTTSRRPATSSATARWSTSRPERRSPSRSW